MNGTEWNAEVLRYDTMVDCNGNSIDDACDLDCGPGGGECDVPGCGLSLDVNRTGAPDECEPPIPTLTEWGMGVLTLLVMTAGTLLFRTRHAVRPRKASVQVVLSLTLLGASLAIAPGAKGQDPALDCPADSLFGQEPELTGGDAGLSDDETPYVRYESFSGLDEPICGVQWWGHNLYDDGTGWAECTENPMPYVITFYEDDSGIPGAEVCSFTVDVPGTVVANVDGRDLYRYEAQLRPCCFLSEGWMSIVGSGDNPSCWFLWASSSTGDDSDCFSNAEGLYCDSGQHFFDLSMCLTYDLVEPIPTLSTWGQTVMTLLVLTAGTILLVRRRVAHG